MAISLNCQFPVPCVRSDDGILPVNLLNTTSFGKWLTAEVVLFWHQRRSKLPIYADESHEGPYLAFTYLENLAIALRPFMHPAYFSDLP